MYKFHFKSALILLNGKILEYFFCLKAREVDRKLNGLRLVNFAYKVCEGPKIK